MQRLLYPVAESWAGLLKRSQGLLVASAGAQLLVAGTGLDHCSRSLVSGTPSAEQ